MTFELSRVEEDQFPPPEEGEASSSQGSNNNVTVSRADKFRNMVNQALEVFGETIHESQNSS